MRNAHRFVLFISFMSFAQQLQMSAASTSPPVTQGGPEHSAHVCFLSKHLRRLLQQHTQSYTKKFKNLAFPFLLTLTVLVALGFCSFDQQTSSNSQVPDLFDLTLCAHLITGMLIHADVLAEIATMLIRTSRP